MPCRRQRTEQSVSLTACRKAQILNLNKAHHGVLLYSEGAKGNKAVLTNKDKIGIADYPRPGTSRYLTNQWGTLKQCNAGAVQRAIHQFSTVPDGSIEVRRKYKTLKNAKQRWWYVLKAEEELLQRLDGEWEGVKLQTGWKLEPCLAYKDSPQSPPTPQSPIPSPANAEPSTSSTAVVTNPATASATPISPDPATTTMAPNSQAPPPNPETSQGNGQTPLEPTPVGTNFQQGIPQEQQ